MPRRYYSFITASGLTNLADGIAILIWAWVASLLTRDPVLIACVAVALRLPWFFCAIPAGLITDRVDRRKLIIGMDIIRALGFAVAGISLTLALPLPPPTDGLEQPAIFAALILAALVVGGAEVFRDNAAQTMLPAIVDQKDLEVANGRLWSVELIGQALIGPALGAFLIAITVPTPFFFNAVVYGIAILLILKIPGQFRPAQTKARDWKREFLEGYNFLKDAPLLRALAWITGFWNLFFQMVTIAMILHVQDNLGLGAQAYGIILASAAVGGVLGGWLGNHVVQWMTPWRTARWMLLASIPAYLTMALAPTAVALALVLAIFEFTGVVWNTVSVSYRQRQIPDEIMGRVNSLYRMLAWGMIPIGLLTSGLVVQLSDQMMDHSTALKMPFVVAALGSTALGIFGWRKIVQLAPKG